MADLFDIVVARKLSGGGGGGSSDFSTATVTVTSQLQDWNLGMLVPVACDDYEALGTCMFSDWIISSGDNPTPFQVVLYKGETKATVFSDDGAITVSGDATLVGDVMLIITGDCTITIS